MNLFVCWRSFVRSFHPNVTIHTKWWTKMNSLSFVVVLSAQVNAGAYTHIHRRRRLLRIWSFCANIPFTSHPNGAHFIYRRLFHMTWTTSTEFAAVFFGSCANTTAVESYTYIRHLLRCRISINKRAQLNNFQDIELVPASGLFALFYVKNFLRSSSAVLKKCYCLLPSEATKMWAPSSLGTKNKKKSVQFRYPLFSVPRKLFFRVWGGAHIFVVSYVSYLALKSNKRVARWLIVAKKIFHNHRMMAKRWKMF